MTRAVSTPKPNGGPARPLVGAEFLHLGHGGVEVDGDVELLRLGEDGPIALFVEVGVAVVAVGLPADEPQFLDRSLEFLDSGVDVGDGQGAVSAVAVGMSVDGRGQRIVRFPGQLDALGRRESLDAWGGEGDTATSMPAGP